MPNMLPSSPSTPISPEQAVLAIRAGNAPDGLVIDRALILSGPKIRTLPKCLTVRRLRLSNCPNLGELPAGLSVRHLELDRCPNITYLPAGLHCYELDAPSSNLVELPVDLRVEGRLNLAGSSRLRKLPEGLTVGSLVLRNCVALTALPEGLRTNFLDLRGCTELADWPTRMEIGIGRLDLGGCHRLRSLPPGLTRVAQLDLSGCTSIRDLPEGLRVDSWIDVGGSGLTGLPASLRGVYIRWRGVFIDERIAFRPQELTADEILHERNAEVRRVMLERAGFEWFFDQVRAEQLDCDRDAGGERRLLRVPLEGDEPLVCITLHCPSTQRRYVLRVPPTMSSCRQAAAWLAGFENPDDYQPIMET